MHPDNIQLLMILVSLVLIVFIVHQIRRQRLYERYAFIWLLVALGMLFFSVFRYELNRIASWLGVYYPPSLILVISVLALILIGLHFSLALTQVKKNQTRLVQELALLRNSVDSLQKSSLRGHAPVSVEEETTG